MATAVYTLCALASGICAIVLIREFTRHRTRLLLWSSRDGHQVAGGPDTLAPVIVGLNSHHCFDYQ
ncbi:MAG: DUF5985 family protein [Acidobacteriota bacterium]